MSKLSKYLIKDWVTSFAVAMLLITFAFSIGAIYKAIDYMARGLPAGLIVRFIVQNLPYSLAYTIPLSALFSTLLLFGRLSADSEVSAMKSGGLSLWQIASPVIVVSFVLMAICLFNNFEVYPKTTYANRQLLASLGVDDPIKLLEEGRFVRDFPGYMIYVGKKNQNRVRDLIVYEVDKDTGKVSRTIRADSGIMTTDQERALLKIDLFNVRIEVPDPDSPDDASKTRYASFEEFPKRLDFSELTRKGAVGRKLKNMTFSDLAWRIRNPEKEYAMLTPVDRERQRCRDLLELNQRVCLSIAPVMFVLIAIPLGIKSHRKESSAGMLISLGVLTVYYMFMIVSDMLEDSPQLHPWLLPWIPIVGGQLAGWLLIRRAN